MSTMRCGTYRGPQTKLVGEHAIVEATPIPGMVLVQFDGHGTGLAFGWYPFPEEDFELDPEIDWTREDTHEEWRKLNGDQC